MVLKSKKSIVREIYSEKVKYQINNMVSDHYTTHGDVMKELKLSRSQLVENLSNAEYGLVSNNNCITNPKLFKDKLVDMVSKSITDADPDVESLIIKDVIRVVDRSTYEFSNISPFKKEYSQQVIEHKNRLLYEISLKKSNFSEYVCIIKERFKDAIDNEGPYSKFSLRDLSESFSNSCEISDYNNILNLAQMAETHEVLIATMLPNYTMLFIAAPIIYGTYSAINATGGTKIILNDVLTDLRIRHSIRYFTHYVIPTATIGVAGCTIKYIL